MELKFELEHVGITCYSLDEAHEKADILCSLFGLKKRLGKTSVFAGDYFEVLRAPRQGLHGHIAMRTNNLAAAVRKLEGEGVKFNYDTASYSEEGELQNIFLQDEIAGFAFHIMQKDD